MHARSRYAVATPARPAPTITCFSAAEEHRHLRVYGKLDAGVTTVSTELRSACAIDESQRACVIAQQDDLFKIISWQPALLPDSCRIQWSVRTRARGLCPHVHYGPPLC